MVFDFVGEHSHLAAFVCNSLQLNTSAKKTQFYATRFLATWTSLTNLTLVGMTMT